MCTRFEILLRDERRRTRKLCDRVAVVVLAELICLLQIAATAADPPSTQLSGPVLCNLKRFIQQKQKTIVDLGSICSLPATEFEASTHTKCQHTEQDMGSSQATNERIVLLNSLLLVSVECIRVYK